MAEITYGETIEIAASAETVFDYRLDFTNLPEYNTYVSNLQRTDGGTLPGPGAEYLFDLTLPGMDAIESPIRVLESMRPRLLVFETGPGYIATERCRFTRSDIGTRCDFEVTISLPGAIDATAAAAMEKQGREQVRLELDNMKKILEGGG